MEILSVLYLIVFAFSGVLAAELVFAKDKPLKRIFFGLVIGLAMLLWLPVIFAFILDFTLLAQLLALFTAAAIGIVCLLIKNKRLKKGKLKLSKEKYENLKPFLLTVIPLALIGIILHCNHTIVHASDGSLHVGQCTFGDLCMHLGFISSISVQKTFPPEYSILPGTPLGYPFLCDSVSSTFYTLGSSLRFAALLPALYAYIIVVLGVWFFFESWFKKGSVTSLATFMFFIGGGLGFAYIFNNKQLLAAEGINRFSEMLTGFYQTPTNLPAEGLRWVNTIADMLVPQRATLFGWALLFPCLQLLYRAVFEKETKLFIPLGILAGCLPLVHTHSFAALGIISVFLFVYQIAEALINKAKADKARWKPVLMFLLFGAITLALASPQLFGFTFKQSVGDSFLRFHFNWDNKSDGYLWFYIKNLGLIFILMLPAFIASKRETKIFYGSSVLIWVICEFVLFQPNPYDNNKLLFIWFAFTCGIVAEFLVNIYRKLITPIQNEENARFKRLAVRIASVFMLAAIFLSGTLTLVREYVSADHIGIYKNDEGKKTFGLSESGYEVTPANMVELTDYINANTEPNAAFLTHNNHNNAVAMLTGRNIFCGAGTFLHWHGVNYQEREALIKPMYENPQEFLKPYAEQYGIDYVLLSPNEYGNYAVNEEWFGANLECVYDNSGVKLFKIIR